MSSHPVFWSSVGFWLLMVGLLGDFVVLFFPSGKTEKAFTAIFTVLIAIGVALEHTADARRLADRTLTDTQVEKIARDLSHFKGQEFNVTPYWNNKESLHLCERIDAALVKAGWKYTPQPNGTMLMGGVVGVLVVADSQADAKVLNSARLLVSSLNEEGISADLTTQHINPKPSSKLDVEVGTKF